MYTFKCVRCSSSYQTEYKKRQFCNWDCYCEDKRSREKRVCKVKSCEKVVEAKDTCCAHYNRWRRYRNYSTLKIRPKGSGWLTDSGYICRQINGRRIHQHRYVMEQSLGRRLKRNEHVHHKNHNRIDNRLENLEVIDASKHVTMHLLERWAKPRPWSPISPQCVVCFKTDKRHSTKGLCKRCYERIRLQNKRREIHV